jgi:hypothetical protein
MKRDSSSLLHISHFTVLTLAIHPFMLSLGFAAYIPWLVEFQDLLACLRD